MLIPPEVFEAVRFLHTRFSTFIPPDVLDSFASVAISTSLILIPPEVFLRSRELTFIDSAMMLPLLEDMFTFPENDSGTVMMTGLSSKSRSMVNTSIGCRSTYLIPRESPDSVISYSLYPGLS